MIFFRIKRSSELQVHLNTVSQWSVSRKIIRIRRTVGITSARINRSLLCMDSCQYLCIILSFLLPRPIVCMSTRYLSTKLSIMRLYPWWLNHPVRIKANISLTAIVPIQLDITLSNCFPFATVVCLLQVAWQRWQAAMLTKKIFWSGLCFQCKFHMLQLQKYLNAFVFIKDFVMLGAKPL